MTAVEVVSALFERLPTDKARSVLDFTRFLAEQADDEAWDRRVEAAGSSPRFRQRLAEVERQIVAGRATPVDGRRRRHPLARGSAGGRAASVVTRPGCIPGRTAR